MRALLPLALIAATALVGLVIYLTDLWRRRKPAPRPPVKPYDHGSDEILTRALWRDETLNDMPTAKADDEWPARTPPWMLEERRP